MELKIKLEDERLCSGCPLETNVSMICRGGFKRTMAKLIEIEGRGMLGEPRSMINSMPIRPTSCVLANERVPIALEHIPIAAEEAPAPIVLELPPARQPHG